MTYILLFWFREITKTEDIRLFGFGVNYEVYIPGRVKLNDNVYLHVPKHKEGMEDIKITKSEDNVV